MKIAMELIALSIFCSVSLGVTAAERRDELVDHTITLLESNATGETVRSEHETYRIVPSGKVVVRASAATENENNAISTVSSNTASSSVWAADFGRFHLSIEKSTAVSTALSASPPSPQYQLAFNTRTKRAAVVTGQIVVQLMKGASVQSIADDYGLSVSADYSHINRAFYTTTYVDELMDKVELLKSDQRINDAYLDILENLEVPR